MWYLLERRDRYKEKDKEGGILELKLFFLFFKFRKVKKWNKIIIKLKFYKFFNNYISLIMIMLN